MHHKLLTIDQTNVKFAGSKEGQFAGYASVFGGVDSYGDTIHPGAYELTLKSRKRPVQMRWNHYGEIIGKWTAIHEDEKGLYVEGELTPGHSKAMDVYASLKHGAISGLSIGYRPIRSAPNDTGGEDLYEIDLIEISVVETPADLAAQIGDIKTAVENVATIKELEHLLRDAGGFSRSAAMAIIAKAANFKDVDPRDAGGQVDEEMAIALRLKTMTLLGELHV